jgi:predicted ArsR family transcriptional regulator
MTNKQKLLTVLKNHKKISLHGLATTSNLTLMQTARALIQLIRDGTVKKYYPYFIDEFGFKQKEKKPHFKLTKQNLYISQKLFDETVL